MKSLAAVALRVAVVLGLLVITGGGVWASSLCTSVTSVTQIEVQGFSCTIGDKTFSNFSGITIPSDWAVAISNPTPNKFQIQVSQGTTPAGTPLGGGGATYDFDFTVSVIEPAPPASAWYIYQVGVSVDTDAGSDAKTLYDASGGDIGTITSTGALVTMGGLNLTTINVDEVITSNAIGTPDSFTDYFYEAAVPEPATMALMGAGLLALGGLLRRKKSV